MINQKENLDEFGAYIPYGEVDAFTKALLERFWSLRHVNNLLRGKLCATVLTGLSPEALDQVNQTLAAELRDYERMDLIGQLTVIGVRLMTFNDKKADKTLLKKIELQRSETYHKWELKVIFIV